MYNSYTMSVMKDCHGSLFFRKPLLTVILLMFSANMTGALAVIFFKLFIEPLPTGDAAVAPAVSPQTIILLVIGQIGLIVTAVTLVRRSNRYFSTWYTKLCAGEPYQHTPEAARREALNFPLRSAQITLVVWVLAGILFGLGISHSLFDSITATLVGGGFSTVLTYFGVELYWRRILLVFFPMGRLSDTRSFHLSIFARLLVVFLVISIYPISLLMVLSLGRARAIVSAPNPDVILDNLFIIEMFLLTVSVAAGVGMVYFVYQTISAPIARLGQMMERVVANDLNVRVVVNSNDEIGKLSDRFNDMVSGLQQREQLRILLNLYVSPQVAREALQHGAALGGQLVTCAVLFSDIRGFTSLSEQLSPEHLIRLLNRYMTVMVETIVAHDGMVNKFGGDSLLAVFGTPLNPNPNYAVDAVCAGLAMQRALECFNEEQRAEGGPEIKAGIGIASGPVVAGNVGGESRIEYTVIGDTVNLASRLQSMTKELGVAFLVDETTVEQVGSQATLQFEALAPLAVRGKHGVVKIYTVRSREKGG